MSEHIYTIWLYISTMILAVVSGYKIGETSVLEELNKSNAIIESLQKENHKKELKYTVQVNDLKNEIETIKTSYNNSINVVNKQSADRLLESERRSEYYRQQAKSCSTQSRDFAEYTTRLDRQLTEGISLVRELTELIKYRDSQLKLVGEQLKLDRELME